MEKEKDCKCDLIMTISIVGAGLLITYFLIAKAKK